MTALTGLISDLWDLNDFWYHTVSGYLMGGFAIAHVVLNWNRLVSYAGFRVQTIRSARLAGRTVHRRRGEGRLRMTSNPSSRRRGSAGPSSRGAVSSGLTIGALGGLAFGRGLRQPPTIDAGSDVGVVYHQWSKPGIIDALGTLTSWGPPVDLYKRHAGAPRVPLPAVAVTDGVETGPTPHRRSSADVQFEPMPTGRCRSTSSAGCST